MSKEFLASTAPIPEQAAGWLLMLAEAPPRRDLRQGFVKWLKRSPQHIEEFLEVAALEQELRNLPADIEEILDEVRAHAGKGAVPIRGDADTVRSRSARRAPPLWRRSAAWATAAGFAALAAAVFSLTSMEERQAVAHHTDFGEQRSITLEDGSTILLNTRSSVEVQYSRKERRVTLVAGEAMFDIAENAAVPFVVDADDVSLRVLGTRFSVQLKGGSVQLAVVEGSVSAVSHKLPHETVVVTAGESAVATAEGVQLRSSPFDVRAALAWTEGRLIFDGARLSEVVAEFNRYNRVPLVIEDERLAERSITTVFNAHDASALVGFLELQPDVVVEHGAEAVRIRAKQ